MAHGVTLNWPGGEHEFSLNLGALRAIQKSCNAGPQEILQRLQLGTWRVDDVIDVLRLGLEGGGVAKSEARIMVESVLDRSGLLALVPIAALVMASALVGEEGDEVGKESGVSQNPENGDLAPSTVPEAQ